MIAGFIILRLRNILGRKTGHESKIFTDFNDRNFENLKNEIKKNEIKEDETNLIGEQRENFLKGAEIAYENIIVSFAKEENKKLKELLTPEMFVNFEQALVQRRKENIKSELTFIGIKESKLEKFEKIKNNFFATVKIVCEIISVKKDKNGEVIDGDPDKIKTVTDHWKFSKNIFSKNPNWYLAEIVSK